MGGAARRTTRAPWLTFLLAGVLIGGCTRGEDSAAPKVEEWKIAIEEIQGSVQDAWAQKFREEIERKTDGAVRVTVYPYGSLGTSDQLTELVQGGAIQLAMASPGHLGKLIPETQLFLLHFVFSEDNDVNRRVLRHRGRLWREFEPLYGEKRLQLLSFFPEGWQVWTTRKPIRAPEDFAGLRFRVMTSPLLVEAYRAYGANPTPLPYGEVYSALQLRMIDGQVNPVFAIEEMSFYEVTDYLIFARHSQFVASVVANQRFYAGLPEERRRLVDDTVRDLEDFIFDVQRDLNARRLDRMREKRPELDVIELSDEEREAFRRASLPVREAYVRLAGSSGERILHALLEEVGEAEAEDDRAGDAAQSSTSG
jgi:tripartite ATP-independent transporter DctP family solute receptor